MEVGYPQSSKKSIDLVADTIYFATGAIKLWFAL
jgi:hypothetical protein